MESKQAYDNLIINDAEKKSIQRYMGFSHTRINMLADFNPSVVKELTSKGWVIAESSQELEEDINDFINIYSAMYKEKKKISTNKLIRGTTNNEARNIIKGYSYNRILSTSTDENIAKRFCQYGNSALIRIQTSGEIPSLYAGDFLEEHSADEEEIIIAPFAKVEKAQITSDWKGYKYYDVTISAPELEEIPQEKIDELKKEVLEQFPEFIKEINGMQENELGMYDEKNMKLYRFRTKIQELMKGLCKQKELEIDRAKEEVKEKKEKKEEKPEKAAVQDKEKIEQERAKEQEQLNKKKAQELILQSYRTNLRGTINNGIKSTLELDDIIKKEYEDLIRHESKYLDVARRLNLDFHGLLEDENIYEAVANARNSCDAVQDDMIESDANNADNQQDIYGKRKDVEEMLDGIKVGKEIALDLPKIREVYDKEAMHEIKKSLYMRVHRIIREEQINKLMKQKEEKQNSKTTFFEKVFGKNELKKQQIMALDLQIQTLTENPIAEQETYRVRDILGEVRAFNIMEKDSKYSQQMERLEESIPKIFDGFSEQEINEIAERKIAERKNLPEVLPEKIGLFQIRKAANMLKQQNETTKQNIHANINGRSGLKVQSNSNSAAMFKNKMQMIANAVKNKEQIRQSKEQFLSDPDKTEQIY